MRRTLTTAAALLALAVSAAAVSRFPDPAVDPKPAAAGPQTAVLAGGCFWGVEAVFERLKGVSNVVSGFAGGSKATAHYEIVSSGTTGHAESVQITYDPDQISYGQLLKVFFAVAHDPTELNRQGPDEGTQYNAALVPLSAEQRNVAAAYLAQMKTSGKWKAPIVTGIAPAKPFYPAEGYHQDFILKNPHQGYIVQWDLPKVAALKQLFPSLYSPTFQTG